MFTKIVEKKNYLFKAMVKLDPRNPLILQVILQLNRNENNVDVHFRTAVDTIT